MLQVRDLDVHLGRARILHGVELDVGETPLALVGRNDMGKTTLCYALLGMLPASSGSIRFAGTEMAGQPAHRSARAGVNIHPAEGEARLPLPPGLAGATA